MILHLGSERQSSSSTDTSSQDSRSVKSHKQVGWQTVRNVSKNELKTAADTSHTSVKDLKMELALEMSKFIEEIEYQLDHVVHMAEFCSVGDVVGCLSYRNCTTTVTLCVVTITLCVITITFCVVTITLCVVTITFCVSSVTLCVATITLCVATITLCVVTITFCVSSVTLCGHSNVVWPQSR